MALLELPHNSRKISRNLSFSALIRILAVILIAVLFVYLFYSQSGKQLEKVDVLEKNVSLNPSDFNKRLQLALAYEEEFIKINNYQFLHNAQEEAKVALELNPSNLYAAKVLFRLNEKDSTELQSEILTINSILRKRPDYQAAWLKLATLYEKIGDYKSAQEAREKAKLLNQNF